MKKVNNLFNAGYGWGRTYPLKTKLKEEVIDCSKEYMYIEALENNTTISFKSLAATSSGPGYGDPYNTLEYSSDQKTWSIISEDGTASTINAGEKLYFRGECTPHTGIGDVGIGMFVVTNKYNAGGNVMSLLFNDDFEDITDLTGYVGAFAMLFMDLNGITSGESTLQSVENLLLPATTLAERCYFQMFIGCTSLTKAPELPATTLANGCYGTMFASCASLTTAPKLPATTLATDCYSGMFSGCANLITAPELPARMLAENCYMNIFSGCSSLNYIKMLATDISAYNCLYNWIANVASTGTFVKNANATWDVTGESGIPKGWTVETA